MSETGSGPIPFDIVLSSTEGVLPTEQGVLLVGGMFLLAGIGVAYIRGAPGLRRARRFFTAAKFDTEGTNGEGSTAITGTIADTNETVTGPLSGKDCVLYEDERQVFRRDYKYDREERIEMNQRGTFDEEEREKRITTWHTMSLEQEMPTFHVETEHGQVAVNPTDAELDLPVRAVDQSAYLHRVLSRFPKIANLRRLLPFFEEPERRRERHVQSGESILVLGSVDESNGDGDAVATVDSGRPFLISTRSRRSLALRNFARGLFSTVPGLLFMLVGIVLIVVAAAMLV